MDELNHLGWVVYKSYEVDGFVFGIRTNSKACGEWLEQALGEYELTDEEAEPYYSLWIPERGERPGQQYYVLYRESSDLLRTFDPARLAQRLISDVEGFTLRRRDDAAFLEAAVVARDGVRALVPSAIVPYMRLAGRRVERELTLPVGPTIGVAPDGRLFPVPPQLRVPETAGADLARRLGADGATDEGIMDVPESIDVVCAFHYDADQAPVLTITRALAVHALAQTALNLHATRGAALPALAALVDGTRCYLLQEGKPKQAFELLKGVLEGDEQLLAPAGG